MNSRKKYDIRHLLRDMPINAKLLLSILVFVFLPFFLGNLFSYSRINQKISENLQNQVDHSVSIAAEKINRQLNGAVALGDIYTVDKALMGAIQQDYLTDMDYFLSYREIIYPRLDQYALMYPEFTAIRLYTDNQTVLSGGGVYHSQGKEQIDKEVYLWYDSFVQAGKDVALLSYPSGRSNQLSLIYRLSKADSSYDALLKVDFSTDSFRAMLSSDIEDAWLSLVDDKGAILVSSNSQAEIAAFSLDSLSVRSSVSLGERMGWQIQGAIADTEVLRSTANAKWILILLMLFGVGGTIALYRFMDRFYVKQINLLLSHMQMVRGQQFIPIAEENIGSDEIGQLMHGFNEMTNEISRLINDVYKLDADKKNLEIENIRAELLNMQSQMDPHFMYNTLSAMMVVSMKENYPKLVDIIYYLSRLLRRMVDRTENNVSIHEEIVFTEMYLRIESFRFRDQFSYDIDVQKEAEDWSIPKFSIQPLVENACKHGIHSRTRAGKVWVHVWQENDNLWILVKDNGNGFSPEQLEKTRQDIRDFSKATASIGLRNIYMRLYYDFYDNFSMTIDSVENLETKITIRIPLNCLKKSNSDFDIPLEPGGGILQ